MKAESKDLSEDGECKVGTVASARRLFESLSSPVRSVAGVEWTPTTGQLRTRRTKSESSESSSSSGYSTASTGLSAAGNTCSSEESETSSQTNTFTSSNPDEFNSDTPVDLSANVVKDTTHCDIVPVGSSDTDASHHSSPVAASNSLSCSIDDDVLRHQVFSATVGEDVTSDDIVEASQLQADQPVTSLCSNVKNYTNLNYTDCSNGVDYIHPAAMLDEKQDDLLETNDELVNKSCILMNSRHSLLEEKDEDDTLEGVQNETVTTCSYKDLPTEHEPVSAEADMKIYKTSEHSHQSTGRNMYETRVSKFYSRRDTGVLLAGEENCTSDSCPEATQTRYVFANEHAEVRLDFDCRLEEQKTPQCVGYKNRNDDQRDNNRFSEDCANACRSIVGRTVARHRRPAPVKSRHSRPCYSSVIHIGSQPDDVVIEDTLYPVDGTVEDTQRPLRPESRRCCVTQSVPWRLVEPRDRHMSVGPVSWRGNEEAPIIIVYDNNGDYVIENSCSVTDDFDDVDALMTSPSRDTHLFAPPVITARRSRVSHAQ